MKKDVSEPAVRGRSRPGLRVAAVLLSLSALSPSLAAQFGPAPKPVTVVKGGTVHLGNGDVLEGANVIVRGSRIEAVGLGLDAPEGATVIDATGRHVYPGLIDAESTLLLDALARQGGEGNLVASVVDALDPFETDALGDALRAGVTTVGVATRRGLLDGSGAVLKLEERARLSDLVLRRDAAITATLGLNGDRPSMRLREWKTIADHLQATKKYVEAWDDYNEKLEEYKKELEKAKKEGDAKKPEGEKGAPAPEQKDPAPAPPTEKPDEKKEESPSPRPRGRRRPGGSLLPILRDLTGEVDLGGPEEADDPDEQGDHDHSLDLKDGVSYADGPPGSPPPPQGGEKKEEGPKKPGRPAREPQREVLRRLLEGKLILNAYVEHAADLENLLELARQYRFRFVVTGGREAAHVADALAEAGVTVVVVQPSDLASDALATAAELDAAGVDVVLTTSGHGGAASRHLALAAAAAIAGGMDKEHALAAITSRAAALLGVSDRVGTLQAGKDADLLITRGELFSSSVVIERVLVAGTPVAAPLAGSGNPERR